MPASPVALLIVFAAALAAPRAGDGDAAPASTALGDYRSMEKAEQHG